MSNNVVMHGKKSDGLPKAISVSNGGALISSDFWLEAVAAEGVDNTGNIRKFGYNEDLDTGTMPEDIWTGGGVYVPPEEAVAHNIVSNNVADVGTLVTSGTTSEIGTKYVLIDNTATFVTDSVAVGDAVLNDTAFDHSVVASIDSETQITMVGYHDAVNISSGDSYRIVTAGGTGCAVLHLKNGLDSDGMFQGEFIIMNGTTDVPTTKSYMRLNRMHNDLTGSAKTNVGTITATTDNVAATVTAEVPATAGQTQMAHFTVPKGKTAYVIGYYASIGRSGNPAGALADITLMIDKFAPVNSVGPILQHAMSVSIAGTSYVYHRFKIAMKQTELTDIFLRVTNVSDNNTYVAGGFDVIMLDN